jgi:hypothetical protein
MIAHYCGADGQDGCDCTAGCIGCCCWYCTGPICAWYWEYEKRKAVEVKLNGGIMVVDNCPIMDCCMVMRPQMYSWQYNIFSFKRLAIVESDTGTRLNSALSMISIADLSPL